jgi:hypothetical protein
MRKLGKKCSRRLLDERDHLLTGDGGKRIEKAFDRVALFEVVNQRLNGYARADKHGRSAHDLRMAVDDWRLRHLEPSGSEDQITYRIKNLTRVRQRSQAGSDLSWAV